jgi:hypothetical protein
MKRKKNRKVEISYEAGGNFDKKKSALFGELNVTVQVMKKTKSKFS